jgi:hypothetical protein
MELAARLQNEIAVDLLRFEIPGLEFTVADGKMSGELAVASGGTRCGYGA